MKYTNREFTSTAQRAAHPQPRIETHRTGLKRRALAMIGTAFTIASLSLVIADADNDNPMRPILPGIVVASTVPANGDVNPYGVTFVPNGFPAGGPLSPGDILVSNFNNKQNLQGTGTTIIKISPTGKQSLFFQGPKGLGLSTALKVLRSGFVLVGNVPTTDGTFATIQQGSILILNRNGAVVGTLSDSTLLDGPWDMAAIDNGNTAVLFVSNVLNGTVTRLNLIIGGGSPAMFVQSATQIASGYLHRGDPAALAIGPTGLAYDSTTNTLFVASTGDNMVFAINNATKASHTSGMGRVVYRDNTHLHGPLGLKLGPNGHLFTTNSDVINSDPNQPSEIVEFTESGVFLNQLSVDKAQGGSFGIALGPDTGQDTIRVAAVDDVASTLTIWTLRIE